jgi:dihydroxyacetone kinase-like protein
LYGTPYSTIEERDMAVEVDARKLASRIAEDIQENKAWLSEIDGAIGDGDHGINMAKGFSMVKDGLEKQPRDLASVLHFVGMTLLTHIGGAMGPIYGTFFMNMAKALEGKTSIESDDVSAMLKGALEGVKKRGGAEVGDKTLVDALSLASSSFDEAMNEGRGLEQSIDAMVGGARSGMENTRDMVARKGRSSRLGERSRGTIDAGAASCFIILNSIGGSIKESL